MFIYIWCFPVCFNIKYIFIKCDMSYYISNFIYYIKPNGIGAHLGFTDQSILWMKVGLPDAISLPQWGDSYVIRKVISYRLHRHFKIGSGQFYFMGCITALAHCSDSIVSCKPSFGLSRKIIADLDATFTVYTPLTLFVFEYGKFVSLVPWIYVLGCPK